MLSNWLGHLQQPEPQEQKTIFWTEPGHCCFLLPQHFQLFQFDYPSEIMKITQKFVSILINYISSKESYLWGDHSVTKAKKSRKVISIKLQKLTFWLKDLTFLIFLCLRIGNSLSTVIKSYSSYVIRKGVLPNYQFLVSWKNLSRKFIFCLNKIFVIVSC